MADKNIYISQQDYSDAQDASELNGWEPNTISEELTAKEVTVTSSDVGIIPADFKDHKTFFIVEAAAATQITFKAGDTYGARDAVVQAPQGTSFIWLDSTKFADKRSGKIKVEANASISIVGCEMR